MTMGAIFVIVSTSPEREESEDVSDPVRDVSESVSEEIMEEVTGWAMGDIRAMVAGIAVMGVATVMAFRYWFSLESDLYGCGRKRKRSSSFDVDRALFLRLNFVRHCFSLQGISYQFLCRFKDTLTA